MTFDWAHWVSEFSNVGLILQIIAVDIVLSGDNAVVIALACRGLPPHQRRMGMLLGAGTAIALRVLFTFLVVHLLGVPWLRLIGAVLLFWIAIKLVTQEEHDPHGNIAPSEKLWAAVRTIAIADAVMSLDNVLAIAGIAKDSIPLLVLGLLISLPLIVVGASMLTSILTRFPILVWACAGLLGWVAGEMFVSDPGLVRFFPNTDFHAFARWAAAGGAVLVVLVGWLLTLRKKDAPAH